MKARQLFDQMLRTQVAPALRELGFRGSRQAFNLQNESGDHALLGFQQDNGNTADACRFTANVGFVSRHDWDRARARCSRLPAKPSPNAMWPTGWWERVGLLLDQPHDHWWTIRTAEDVPAIADHVVAVVRCSALPYLRAHMAGREPPAAQATDGDEAQLDCPWPYCSNSADLYLDDVDPDSVDGLDEQCFGAVELTAAQQDVLERARRIIVPRTHAWKVLHVSRKRLDDYADRVGAGPALTFAQLLAVSLLGEDDVLKAARWPAAAQAVDAWVQRLTDGIDESALVVAEDVFAVTSMSEHLELDDWSIGLKAVYPLIGFTRQLLEELSSAGLV